MLNTISPIVEFLAFFGAVLFFGFKILSGFFIHNLSVSLNCSRTSLTDTDKDVIIVTAKLTKGDVSALTLHDMKACISYGEHTETVEFHGIRRCSYKTEKIGSTTRKVIRPDRLSESSPLLNFGLGEEGEFSCSVEVPANETVVVELIVLGKRAIVGTRMGQCRSSTVVAPL